MNVGLIGAFWPGNLSTLDLWADVFVIALLLVTGYLGLRSTRQSRTRTHRLAAANAIAAATTRAQDYGSIVLTALEELQKLMAARAAWFRLLDGEHLVLTEQIGLSENFLRTLAALDLRCSPAARMMEGGVPVVVRRSTATAPTSEALEREGLDHFVVVPVKGKNAIIGAIGIGQAQPRAYLPDEMEFLAATANQIGIAVENLRLLEHIVRSHREWISTFDSIDDLILVHDARFRVLKLNRALLQRLRHDYTDVIFQPCEAVLPGGGQAWRRCPYCEPARANFTEGPDPCFGGFSLVSSSTIGEEGGAAGRIHIVRDITERRAAEEKYRLLFEQVQEGVFVSNVDGRLLDCNDAFVRMLGYDNREQVLALDIAGQMWASPEQRQVYAEAIARRGYLRNYEVTLRRRDGSLVTALENSFATRDAAGRIERYQGFLLDITEKKRAEDEIRRRNRELHALNTVAVIATQSFDLDEILGTALRQVVELFAADAGGVWLLDSAAGILRRHAAVGFDCGPDAPDGNLPVPDDFLQCVLRERPEVYTQDDLPRMPEFIRDFVARESLASWVWVLMWAKDKPVGVLGVNSRTGRPFTATDQGLMVNIARQLATTIEKVRLYEETCKAYEDLRHTQEQLLQSEKMSAIGQLISGVAHEINNPLTAILGYSQLLEAEALSPRGRDFLDKLFKQAQRTQHLVQNLLSFARQRKPEKKEVDIRSVLENTLALRDYDLKRHNIQVRWEGDAELPAVIADAHQMEQVFLNIINNAVDAMLESSAHGGELRVRVFSTEGRVCAEFHDSGPGIEDVKKVFDPFYTTKKIGKGTGLGLSICYGIVKEHGGEIVAQNHAQGGALFRVDLPASETVPARVSEAKPDREERATRLRGRILVVDDEEAVRDFESEVLAGAGAEVVTVASAEEAIHHLQTGTFDAIIAASTLGGGWSGTDLYRWLAANQPGVEGNIILAVSNIRDGGDTGKLLQQGSVPTVFKPFQVAELISVTRSVLSRRRAAAAN